MKQEKIKKKKVSWNIPETEFGRNIFNTIPRKIDALTRIYGIKQFRGTHNDVHWNLKSPGRYIFVQNYGTIMWTGKATTPRDTRFIALPDFDTSWVKNIENNLEKFVQLEKIVYEAVEKFCEQERDIQTRKTTTVQ